MRGREPLVMGGPHPPLPRMTPAAEPNDTVRNEPRRTPHRRRRPRRIEARPRDTRRAYRHIHGKRLRLDNGEDTAVSVTGSTASTGSTRLDGGHHRTGSTRHQPSNELGGSPKCPCRTKERHGLTLRGLGAGPNHHNGPESLPGRDCPRSRNIGLSHIGHCPI